MKVTPSLIAALIVVCGVSLLTAQPVWAQEQAARADDKPVTLIRTAKADEKARYRIVIKAEVMGLGATMTTIRKDMVKEVKKNGDIVTLVTPESAEAELGGMPIEVKVPPPYSLTRSKLGKLLEYKPEAEDESLLSTSAWKLVNALTEPLLAAKEVKTKDTWETELENPLTEDKKFTVKSVFLGMDKLEGVDLWKIRQTAEPMDMEGHKIPYEQTSWLDPKNGHIVKVEATMKEVPTNTQFGKLTLNMVVTPVKEEPKAEEKKETK